MADLLPFPSIRPEDLQQVGGKGLSLGLMLTAGLNVPPGFVVTTAPYRRLATASLRADPELVNAIRQAYAQLGGGLVAVRSSATSEDGAVTSFAGQQDTFLGVRGEDALLDAIESCWRSLHTERAKAYRLAQGLQDDQVAMAVVVQRLISAEVAGVLFTRDPFDVSGELISIEAAWGLGEAVVSGKITPDRYRVRFDTGEVAERHAGHKPIQIIVEGELHVSPDRVNALCLCDQHLQKLAELARRVEGYYQAPRDIEWAIVGEEVYLLQARPITSLPAAQLQQIRHDVIHATRALADPTGTVWVRYNLSEVLPEPTPMTWSIVQRLLSAQGGFGAMNRDLGGEPDPTLGASSAFDLIAGRPMCNLSHLPKMQFPNPLFEYPFASLKANPALALNPKPVFNTWKQGLSGLFRLPWVMFKLSRVQSTTRQLAEQFAEPFLQQSLPQFQLAARSAMLEDLSGFSPASLLEKLEIWVQKTLVDFAKESLKPTVLADFCWTTLLEVLKLRMGEAGAAQAVAEVAHGAAPPVECDYAKGIERLARGELTRTRFLELFGHRCRNEMELSQPRWAEDPTAIDRLLNGNRPDHRNEPEDAWPKIVQRGKLGPATRAAGLKWATRLRQYLGLREAAKHHLLMGYGVIRRLLVELDQRHRLNQGIFFVEWHELPELIRGTDFKDRIQERKRRRQQELSLELPAVLFSDDLEAIGRPIPQPIGTTLWQGLGVSAGVAEASAFVVRDPSSPPPVEPYILVCPSTDPAWVPLFAQSKGLVMETGGVLSHGAIVAREFGLPAVAGLPNILQQLQTGQRLRVDGNQGTITVISS